MDSWCHGNSLWQPVPGNKDSSLSVVRVCVCLSVCVWNQRSEQPHRRLTCLQRKRQKRSQRRNRTEVIFLIGWFSFFFLLWCSSEKYYLSCCRWQWLGGKVQTQRSGCSRPTGSHWWAAILQLTYLLECPLDHITVSNFQGQTGGDLCLKINNPLCWKWINSHCTVFKMSDIPNT